MASDSIWPPSAGLSTPTVPRAHSILSLASSIKISAPAQQVFRVILDTSTYPSWCTFVPRVAINSQPREEDPSSQTLHLGTTFTFYAVMDPSKPHKEAATNLVVTDISTPENQSAYISKETLENDASFTANLNSVYRVSWAGDGRLFPMVLKSERFHEIIITKDNECEVRTWEVMGGVLARAVRWLYQDTLDDRFNDWNANLKNFCEKTAMK